MKKVAVVGIMGVPAKYGGFETLVENIIGENASENIQYTIFCSKKSYLERPVSYKGAHLKYVPLKANGIQSTPYDILSLMKCVLGYDVIVILGVSGCLFLPIFRLFFHKKLIDNIDGLEHKREKWSSFAKKFLLYSEKMAVKYADVVVADNKGIKNYVCETYHKEPVLIAYGGDHVNREVGPEYEKKLLQKYGLENIDYVFSVCRVEPENNCHHILEAFAKSGKRVVFVGNFEHSEYAVSLKEKYKNVPNIQILGAIYDLDVLYVLRKNCRWYVHGHSAGGTNPSLVEAMHFGRTIFAYDVVYNRETTHNKAFYWQTQEQLLSLLNDSHNECGEAMKEIAQREYRWKKIAKEYEALY